MTQEPAPHPDSPSVQTHLNIVQGVIQRMAENSRACKFWCVTIVSATLVLVARTEKPEYAFMQQYRASLIHHVVTGKLDVRQGCSRHPDAPGASHTS